jgi:hypothetical protein
VDQEESMLERHHIDAPPTETISDRELGIAVVLLFVILALSAVVVPVLA